MARPTGPVRALRTALPVLALALGLLAPGQSAAQGLRRRPRPSSRWPQAYTAAWNAHDLPAVLALFAPDAVVRERRGAVPPDVWDTRDPQVVRAYLDDVPRRRQLRHPRLRLGDRPPADRGVGGGALRASTTASRRARTAPPGTRWAGRTRRSSTPTSSCRASARPRATRRRWCAAAGSRVLTLVQSPASVQRRQGEADAALARVAATHRASPLGDGPRLPLSGPPRAAAEPTAVGWPLALGGLALLAAVTGALRRRRLP